MLIGLPTDSGFEVFGCCFDSVRCAKVTFRMDPFSFRCCPEQLGDIFQSVFFYFMKAWLSPANAFFRFSCVVGIS